MINICAAYAESEEDRNMLEQFRPYIAMMRARAIASQMISDEEPKAALYLIDRGLEELKTVYEEQGRPEEFAEAHETQILRGMRDELRKKLPASQRAELKQRLEEAIRNENYELAAILRDELKMLRE
jgi:excinuclease UvrABC helicase subunit UvrB